MKISLPSLRTLFLASVLLAASAQAQMSVSQIITLPASPIPETDFVTILVPARGCKVDSHANDGPALASDPVVSVTQATRTSAGAINISVEEIAIVCQNGLAKEALFAVPISVGRLSPGAYTINYPTHSLSLDITVSSEFGGAVGPLPGLWAITEEVNGSPGRGFQVQQHGNTMVLTFYGYDAVGKGRFWLASGEYHGNVFEGALTTYDGGTPFGGSSQSAHAAGEAGTVGLMFTSPTTGFITLPGEPQKAISYFQF